MSDSRLEKFIYAICSMDVSDLPVPLSRIEKLWNCLITGETPDFEPLSRNEKYLMAMLDRYDISNLPAPMSRGEKLLYKIAVGETDLSDVPGYLSRYEELLKYLIENGGIGFEYVLYTLNQSLSTLYSTAEKPVKSAILKGNTLVNLLTYFMPNVDYMDGQYRIRFSNVDNFDKITIVNKNSKTIKFSYFSNGWQEYEIPAFNNVLVEIPKETNEYNIFALDTFGWDSTNYREAIDNIVLLHGDYVNVDIPYFEGMQSVKMPVLKTTGKNLFDLETWASKIDVYPEGMERYEFNISGDVISGIIKDGRYFTEMNPKKGEALKLNTTYTLSHQSSNCITTILLYRPDSSLIIEHNIVENKPAITFTTPNEPFVVVFRFGRRKTNTGEFTFRTEGIQLEENSTPTSYEPYKSNILTVNEEVELRGIGEVQDELDLITGELNQRFAIFNDWDNADILKITDYGLVSRYDLRINVKPKGKVKSNVFAMGVISTPNLECINVHSTQQTIQTQILTSKLSSNTIDGFKEWAKNNNYIIVYESAEESIKTVDLTTVDQDGQPTKLKTFNDITHVEIKANNLIPSVDVEVATKISETLSTMGPQQLELSETQNKLGQTIDEQTENTDATMLATTEIYEQTL